MNLEEGNWDKLKGKAVVYSTFENMDSAMPGYSGDGTLAAYVSNDVDDFMQKTGISQQEMNLINGMNGLVNNLMETMNSLKSGDEQEFMQKMSQPINPAGNTPKIMAMPLPHVTQKFQLEQLVGDCDRIFAGNFKEFVNGITAVQMNAELYKRRYMELLENLQAESPLAKEIKSTEAKKPKMNYITHKDFKGCQIMDYLTREYVGPMFDARNAKDQAKLKSLAENLGVFAANSPF